MGDGSSSMGDGSSSMGDGSSSMGDGSATGDAGGDRCSSEATRICYSGPPGTIAVGRCRGGTQACGPDGRWSTCTGEVLPSMGEICGNRIDDDCNGTADDMCGECTAGMTRAC
jgi:hypothetical protein